MSRAAQLLIGLLCLFLSAETAVAQVGSSKSVPALTTEINTLFPSGIPNAISAHSLRQVVLDIINSYPNSSATTFVAANGSFTSGNLITGFGTASIQDSGKAASNVALLNVTDQTLSGGANVTSNNIGTVSSGTTTIDCGKSPLQYYTNGGAHTLAAPASDGSCIVLTTNNASAGTITFSGFSVGSNTGDALDTTNTHKFSLSIWRINGTAGYTVSAHQ